MILEGKTIVVTGVGTGLGCEVARLALRDGANVVMGARTEKQLAENANSAPVASAPHHAFHPGAGRASAGSRKSGKHCSPSPNGAWFTLK